VTNLVATFTTTGASVTVVATGPQTSGTTANNFTNPVVYTVTAADTTTATYTVTVTVAQNFAKAITAYSLAGVTGSIAGSTISVTMPFGTDVTNLVATFTTTGASVTVVATGPQTSGTTANNFTNPVVYTVTAADTTTATYSVTVSLAVANPTAPSLGEAGRFVILASQAITTTGTTAISDGDIGIIDIARTGITGFTPSGPPTGDYAELVNGTSFAPDDLNPSPFPYPLHYSTPTVGGQWTTTAAMITQVRTDLGIADTFLAADPNPGAPTQVCQPELGGLTLTRGVYKSAVDVVISTGDLHLDAQGDPNAVFIFVIAGTFTTGAPGGNIILENGALARNVFWRSGGITVIGQGTNFYGNVFAATQVNLLAGANVTGRLYAVTDRVTLIADTVKKAP